MKVADYVVRDRVMNQKTAFMKFHSPVKKPSSQVGVLATDPSYLRRALRLEILSKASSKTLRAKKSIMIHFSFLSVWI